MSGCNENILKTLKEASNDTERVAALYVITKTIKRKEIKSATLHELYGAVNINFYKKLINFDEKDDTLRYVAICMISCFSLDEKLRDSEEILSFIPTVLDIVASGNTVNSPAEKLLIKECYQYLQQISNSILGCKELVKCNAICILCQAYVTSTVESGKTLLLLISAISSKFNLFDWEPFYTYHDLINRLAVEFEIDQTMKKFKLIDTLSILVANCPSDAKLNCVDELWPLQIKKGINNILCSKICQIQRDPTMKLTSVMLSTVGTEWLLTGKESKPFLLILIHLCCVELRMQLEDRDIDVIVSNLDLIKACLIILEYCNSVVASDSINFKYQEKQKLHICLKEAFSSVISNSALLDQNQIGQDFLYTTIRSISSWLALETGILNDAVYEILPFLIKTSNETFNNFQKHYVNERIENNASIKTNNIVPFDNLRLLLPAMCHLSFNEKSRKIILSLNEEVILFNCFKFYWSILTSESVYSGTFNTKTDIEKRQTLNEQEDAKDALISMCNIFMNLIITEKGICKNDVFENLLEFLATKIFCISNCSENLLLRGYFCVLGLLLLRHSDNKSKRLQFLQEIVTFFQNAFFLDKSNDCCTVQITTDYKLCWSDVEDLWFLGIRNLTSAVTEINWIGEFINNSDWIQLILEMLKSEKPDDIKENLTSLLEDLLSNLAETSNFTIKLLKQYITVEICQQHNLNKLKNILLKK